jgi:hypothetical protein
MATNEEIFNAKQRNNSHNEFVVVGLGRENIYAAD